MNVTNSLAPVAQKSQTNTSPSSTSSEAKVASSIGGNKNSKERESFKHSMSEAEVLSEKKFEKQLDKKSQSQLSETKDRGSNVEARKFEKPSQLSEKMEKLNSYNEDLVDPLMRRSAIQSFMKKMNDDFGVQPLQIASAFSGLNSEDLGLSPDQTIGKVIQSLNLKPEDQKLAFNHFNTMVNKSESGKIADYLKAGDRQISLEVLSHQQAKQNDLDASINKLNNSFFNPKTNEANKSGVQQPAQAIGAFDMLKNPETVDLNTQNKVQMTKQEAQAALVNKANSYTQDASLNVTDSKESSSLLGLYLGPNAGPLASGQSSNMMSQNLKEANSANNSVLNDVLEGAQVTQVVGKPQLSTEELAQNLALNQPQWAQGIKNNLANKYSQGAQEVGAEVSQVGLNNKTTDLNLSSSSVVANVSEAGDHLEEGDQSMDQQADQLTFAETIQTKGRDSKISTPNFQLGNSEMNEAEEGQNVKDMIKQTQVLIKNGGGEIKMKLAPEGVGEVDLKVNIKEGKVQIDLLSDSPDVRKLIEKGMGDLKATLAAHKLDVDQIKVDTSSDIMEEFNDQNEDAESHFAKQFLGQFRQQNQAFHGGLGFDEPGMKDQMSDEADNSEASEDAIKKVKSKSSSDRRLDLVA